MKKKKTKKPITYQNHPDCVSLHNLVSFRRVLEQKLWGFPLRFTIWRFSCILCTNPPLNTDDLRRNKNRKNSQLSVVPRSLRPSLASSSSSSPVFALSFPLLHGTLSRHTHLLCMHIRARFHVWERVLRFSFLFSLSEIVWFHSFSLKNKQASRHPHLTSGSFSEVYCLDWGPRETLIWRN